MAQCQQCLQRMCRKHPLLDHGKRAAELKSKIPLQKTKLNDLLRAQIEKMEAAAKGTNDDENDSYRSQLNRDRATIDVQQQQSIGFKRKSSDLEKTLLGLNPDVAAVMLANDDDSISESEYDSSDKKTKKLKKDKKSKDKKEKKDKKKKDKKDKKDKKKKDKKDKKKSYSSSSSDNSDSG
jgi:hypothetical protein